MKSHFSVAAAISLLLAGSLSERVFADDHFVNANSPSPAYPYLTWQTAATVIQDAVAAAAPGETIYVTNGLYATGGATVGGSLSNRVAVAKALTLQSVNGPAVTTILGQQLPGTLNGEGAVRGVYLTNNAVLIGFTISQGATRDSAGTTAERQGGGVYCRANSAVVSNCVVTGNAADSNGGGISGGKILQCVISGNSATNGGGVYGATLTNCQVSGNSAFTDGGGIYAGTATGCVISNNQAAFGGGSSSATLNGCTLSANSATFNGGADYFGTATNCLFANNNAAEGGGGYGTTANACVASHNRATGHGGGAQGGIWKSSALLGNTANEGGGSYNSTLGNCTVTGNTGTSAAGGAAGGNVYNSILYFNSTANRGDANYGIYYLSTVVNYCCTTPVVNGTGNFDSDPALAASYHLSAESPCRGAGKFSYVTGKDIDAESWANPPSVGCDEFSGATANGELTVNIAAPLTNAAPGFALSFAADIGGSASANRWDFGDGTVVSNTPFPSHAWTAPGDYAVELRAYNSTYPGGIAATQRVHIATEVHYVAATGSHPQAPYNSWATAASNIQDAIDVAVLPGATVLVTNGVYQTGGRVIYGTLTNRVAVTKPLRVVSVNGPEVTTILGYHPPGDPLSDSSVRCVYLTNGALLAGFTLTNGATHNLFSGDAATESSGGGAWCESLQTVVSNCVIAGNYSYYGGGVCCGTHRDCQLLGNSAGSQGGAAFNAILERCIVANNAAGDEGGGFFGGAYYTTLNNCLVYSNAANSGAGVFQAGLTNCTLVANQARSFGGGADSSQLYNCIAYYNSASAGPNYYNASVTNCCTDPLPAGLGNFTNAPSFVDLAGADFHLRADSPCIGAANSNWSGAQTDLDGRPRLIDGAPDLGAFEFQGTDQANYLAWLKQFGFSSRLATDSADPDQDAVNNFQEYQADTNPTNALSWFHIQRLSAGTPCNVFFNSSSNRTYTLYYCSNLKAGVWTSVPAQTRIPGTGGLDHLSDPAPVTAARFYRVAVELP